MNHDLNLELIRKAGFHMRPSIENTVEGIDWNCGSCGYDRCVDELIGLTVLECIQYINEDYQRDFDTKWRDDLSVKIKQHFGVA